MAITQRHHDSIELKPSELKAALIGCIRANVVACILGSPGIGKSDIVKQTVADPSLLEWFKERYGCTPKKDRPLKSMCLIDERASTMDLADWRGVPMPDQKKQRTVWYPPDFLPTEDDGPTVVFFDEITQVKADCQPPLYQLLLDGKLGTVYKAPSHTRFVCAGNLMDDGTFVNKLGSALRDRMVFLYVKADLDDWTTWAYAANVAPSVIGFLRFRPEALYAFDKTQMVSPTARGWEFVSRIVQTFPGTGRVRDALIEGKIGHPWMTEFTAFERIFSTLPSVDEIVKNPSKAPLPSPDKPELAYAISNALAMKATTENFSNILIYVDRLPEEYGVFTVKMAIRRDSKLQTLPAFTKWFVDHSTAMA